MQRLEQQYEPPRQQIYYHTQKMIVITPVTLNTWPPIFWFWIVRFIPKRPDFPHSCKCFTAWSGRDTNYKNIINTKTRRWQFQWNTWNPQHMDIESIWIFSDHFSPKPFFFWCWVLVLSTASSFSPSTTFVIHTFVLWAGECSNSFSSSKNQNKGK